jgi:hypothetical protein
MLRFFASSRLARNPDLYFEIASNRFLVPTLLIFSKIHAKTRSKAHRELATIQATNI